MSSIVLGIDPGLSRCGYCVIEAEGRQRAVRALGVIHTEVSSPLPNRLMALQDELSTLMADFRPGVIAMERVLFSVNVRTAMYVGQASGLVLVEAARLGADVAEYSPNQVKMAVTGYGAATKQQVQVMVQSMLKLTRVPEPADAADAAAVALCHLSFAGSRRQAEEVANR